MADTSKKTDYAEQWLEAMDVLVNKRIEAVRFDQTIDATITDNSKAEDGEYTVSTGHATFIAYSTETKYRVNDQVMVTIPQGNYDNQKMIIGKRVDKNNSPLVYQSPFQRIIDITNNLINIDLGTVSFWANRPADIIEGRPWDSSLSNFRNAIVYTDIGCIWDSGEIYYEKLTHLGIKAQFSSWLNEYLTIAGNYGLAVEITFKNTELTENNTFTNILTFDSNEFFGDVYNFETFFTQENVYDLTEFVDFAISRIRLFAYQRNNFINKFGSPIYEATEFSDGQAIAFPPNLFIKDIYICLGTAREDFQTDTATLISESTSTYRKGAINASAEDIDKRNKENKKFIGLRWIHKDIENDVIKAIEPHEFPADYEIRWYRHQNGAKSPDEFAGAHWVRFYGCRTQPDSATQDWAISKEEVEADSTLDIATNQLEIDFYPNVNYQNELLKAVVLKNEGGTVYRRVAQASPIEFTNDDDVSNRATIIDENALSIRFNDDCKGFYFIYNRAGSVGRQEDSKILRTLTAVFGPEPNINDKKPLELPYDSIEWIFPENNNQTMIIPAESTETGARVSTERIKTNVIEVGYFIKPRLNRNAINNTVQLKINKGGVEYTARVQMSFGTAGTSGSDYTLDIRWDNSENVLDLSKKNDVGKSTLSGRAYLLDQNHQLVDFQNDKSDFEFSWYKVYDPNPNAPIPALKLAKDNIRYPIGNPENKLFFANDDANVTYSYITDKKLQIADYLISDYPSGTQEQDKKYSYYDFVNQKKFIDDVSLATALTYSPCAYRRDTNPHVVIEFIPISNVEHEDISSSDEGKLKYNADTEDWTYYYSSRKRAFVKYNDTYIIDPWAEYSEVETYYFPINTQETVISNNSELQIIIPPPTENIEKGTFVLEGNPDINSLYILEVKVVNFGDYDIISRIPIPIKTGDYEIISGGSRQDTFVVDYINGATSVRYASSGETDFDKMPYQIFTRIFNNNTFIQKNQIEQNDENFGYWRLIYDDGISTTDSQQAALLRSQQRMFVPSLTEQINDTIQTSYVPNGTVPFRSPTLTPPGLYFAETPLYGVQFIQTHTWDNNGNLVGITHRPIWTQPIYSFQDNYPSTTLNKWNGKDIQTEEDTGTIVANGLAAGKKERDNTFTGVVLGDWSRTDTDAFITKQTGVYGFNHGAMSYALKDDGTAFFGKDGAGRIYLAGDKALIYSANWLQHKRGMLLDLNKGAMKLVQSSNYERRDFTSQQAFSSYVNSHQTDANALYYFLSYKPVTDSSQFNQLKEAYVPNTFIVKAITETSQLEIPLYTYYIYYSQTQITYIDYPTGTSAQINETLAGIIENESTKTYGINNQHIRITHRAKYNPVYTVINNGIETEVSETTAGAKKKIKVTITDQYYHLVIKGPMTVAGQSKYLTTLKDLADFKNIISQQSQYDDVSIRIIKNYMQVTNFSQPPYNSYALGFYFTYVGTYEKVPINESYNPEITYFVKSGSEYGSDRYVTLSAAEKDYPLAIGPDSYPGQRPFRVRWDGNVYIEDGIFTGIITATGGAITGDLTVTGTLTGGTFITDTLYANLGEIGGWTISDTALESYDHNTILRAKPSGSQSNIETNTISVKAIGRHNLVGQELRGKLGYISGSGDATVGDTDAMGFISEGQSLILGVTTSGGKSGSIGIRTAEGIFINSGTPVNTNNTVTGSGTIQLYKSNNGAANNPAEKGGIVLSGNYLTVKVKAENQVGIYARFA